MTTFIVIVLVLAALVLFVMCNKATPAVESADCGQTADKPVQTCPAAPVAKQSLAAALPKAAPKKATAVKKTVKKTASKK